MKNSIIKLISAAAMAIAMVAASHAGTPVRIAFVDTGNTGRSMTAAALATQWAHVNKADVAIISRAVSLNPYNVTPEQEFVKLLAGKGIDVSTHRAAQFDKGVVTFSDLIFVMTPAHREKILTEFPEAKAKVVLLSEYATGQASEVLDAYGQAPAFYVNVFKQISELIPQAMEKLPKK